MMTKINSMTQLEPSHIVSWIEHHRRLGVEHFIIYDNQIDPNQHRPLAAILARYIDEGLVTYIWYPIQDCIIDSTNKGKTKGERFKVSQVTSTNGVLRRYAQRTEFLIHADTDEFILFKKSPGSTLVDVLRRYPSAEYRGRNNGCNLHTGYFRIDSEPQFDPVQDALRLMIE